MEACDPVCRARGIPDYLHQNGRDSNQVFDVKEVLFIRFRVEERKLKSVISFCRQSANRSMYCEGGADDALFDGQNGGRHEGFGVYEISAAAVNLIKKELNVGGNLRTFTLRLFHNPDQCNYAHTEIVACEGGNEVDDIGPKSVKKMIREEFHEAIRPVLPPNLAGIKFEAD